MIFAARPPRDISRDGATTSGDFVRGWWCGVQDIQAGTGMSVSYRAGYAAGLAWREFHGPGRRPNETHAADARELHRAMPDAAEALRLR